MCVPNIYKKPPHDEKIFAAILLLATDLHFIHSEKEAAIQKNKAY